MAEFDVELGPLDDIDAAVELLLKHDEEVKYSSYQSTGSIFMVPSIYRDLHPHSYQPQTVSIGPLHHEDVRLKGFEVQKATYMHNLLHNILRPLDSTPEKILKECVTRVSVSLDQIKACYVAMPPFSDSKLVTMMVTDACFILSFIYKPARRQPIKILLDMVLIENQIPFCVLQDIFDCTFLKLDPTLSLADLIIPIQRTFYIFDGDLEMDYTNISSKHDHILDFLYKSYQHPDQNPDRHRSRLHGQYPKAHSVVELDRSGVRFKKLDAKWPMAMELEVSRFPCFPLYFCSKPTLKMPVLHLYDGIESMIRNLIIYENSIDVHTCVASYMYAMDMLIDTPEDVTRLVKSQVIVNRLGSDEKAADLINSMLEGVRTEDFYYGDEWKIMDVYYSVAGYRKIQTDFGRKYFSNPWSAIALLAGIVLFVLTVVQTVYSVKDSKDA